MAKKTFRGSGGARNRQKEELKEALNKASTQTKEAFIKTEDIAMEEEVIEAKALIMQDAALNPAEQKVLLDELERRFNERFSFENCPNDYESLKNEAKFLARMSSQSFIFMAQRLKKIRDEQLYKEDGYTDFKSFIESEIDVARATVYRYIDVYDFFGVSPVRQGIPYSRLFPVIPLLKADKEKVPVDEIKNDFLEKAKNHSRRELEKMASDMQLQYKLKKPKNKLEARYRIVEECKKLPMSEITLIYKALERLIIQDKMKPQ